jgi:RecA-family ATPase
MSMCSFAAVLIVCFEDGKDELRRRVTAAMMHYRISKDEIRGYLFLSVMQRPDAKLLTSVSGRDFAEGKLGPAIEQAIARRKLDAVLLDPFIKAHGVPENDNIAMDMSAGILTSIAVGHNVAVGVLHHNRKGPDDPGNPDIGRGGGSLKDAGRLVFTLTPMSQDEADLLGIDADGRAALIRLDHAKVNLVRCDPHARWFALVGVSIGNQTELYPRGDEIQTVRFWAAPDVFKGLSHRVKRPPG